MSDSGLQAEPIGSQTAVGTEVRIPRLPASRLGPQVGAIGAFEIEGPCLYLRSPDGNRTLPLFATESTRWNQSAGSLEVGDKLFKLGQTVTLGGSPLDRLPTDVEWIEAPHPACSASRVFIVRSIEAG